MKFEIKPIEAMQVPLPGAHEAAKDHEARYMKLCSWLDEHGATSIDFGLGRGVEFEVQRSSHDGDTRTYPFELGESTWIIVSNEPYRFRILSDESFSEIYQAVAD